MRTAAHRLLVALLLALIGVGYLAGGPGARAQDDPVGGAGDGSLQLGLPIPVGERWDAYANWYHGMANNGYSTPAILFSKPSPATNGPTVGASVLSMRGGIISLPCAGMVKIDHGGGISSVYYPVGDIAVTAGQTVARGQRLGGSAASGECGGSNSGAGTFMAWVQRNGADISLVGHDVGGWTVKADHGMERGSYTPYIVNDGDVGTSTAPQANVSLSVPGGNFFVGELIDFTLGGFPAGAPVTLEWRRADGSIVPLGTTRTSGGGTAEGRVTIPESPRELYPAANHALVARTSTITRRAFTLVSPVLTLSSDVLVRGETVTLGVKGFSANASVPVTVMYAGQGSQALPQRITTDRLGNGLVTFAISSSAPFGRGSFRLADDVGGAYADRSFEVVGQPTLSFSFDSPQLEPIPGDPFVAYLRKFPANVNISLEMAALAEGGNPSTTVYQLPGGRTDANGAATISGTFPADMVSDPFFFGDGGSGGAFEFSATGGGRTATTIRAIFTGFSVSPASAPPGGQVTLHLIGWIPEASFTLDWWDGELWQPLGDYTVPASRRLALVVPAEAEPGLTTRIGRRMFNDRGFPYWLRQANVLITDPGSNTPPTANAGPDRTVGSPAGGGVAVALSGAGSTDPGGGIASYTWRENGTQIATGVSPTVTLAVGLHTIQLTVVDGGGLAAVDTVVITVGRPPVANAGPDRTVADPEANGQAVTLDGAGSSDPDGTISTYVWKEGTTQLATGAQPTVTLAAGTHTITLTVTDDDGLTATDTVVVTVAVPRPPVANAGPDQTVADPENNGQAVRLTGAGSTDPDGNGTITSYVWREGTAQLATGVSPSVTLPVGTHTIVLTVTDDTARTATDTVVITVTGSRPPVASAGPDQTVADPEGNGQAVSLNGAGSSDPDGTIASYIWREGSTQRATGRTPSVTLAVGVHTIVLTVTDNAGLTATDTVVITVTGPPPPASLTLDKLSGKFNAVVTASLTGFTPNSAVTLHWPNLFPVDANGAPSTDLLASGTTDGAGRATLTFRTPLQPFVSTGYVVTARDAAGKSATATHRVIPRILLNEVEGNRDTRLRVYFYGFAPNERIEVRWHAGPDGNSPSSVIFTLTVAANGRAVSPAFAPPAGAVGAHKVVGKVIGVNRSASTTFTLTAGGASVDDPTPTATPKPGGTATATATPTQEATQTPAPTETATPELTETATPEPTATATSEPTPTETPTPEPAANASPVAAAGEGQTATDVDGTGDEPVQLDASGSTDPEGGPLTYAWSVDGVEIATGAAPSVTLPVGTTTVTLTVTDAAGATASDEVSIMVEAAPPAAPAEASGDDPGASEDVTA